ncbi:MAG: DUF427 domain-containing protein [candidate division Zixibacteria bacterium]|nr:DUF427 domain-containing protein [candidate division Zixibacteria bacterium]
MTNSFTVSPRSSEFGPSPRWVRVYFNSQLIAESRKMMLLREADHLPVYYFPQKDVRMDCLQPSDRTSHSDFMGEATYWHLQVGDKIAKNAAFTFRNPLGNGPDLKDYIAFAWKKMDAWFEEEEEVFVYARDPHKRIDILPSSRHIKVVVDGITVGETKRPWLLFETGLPIRYYMPKHDARMDLLEPSEVVTSCPYKGDANLYSIKIDDKLHENLAWIYRFPTAECARIQGLVCFFNEKLDIYEDDTLLPRPKTAWS